MQQRTDALAKFGFFYGIGLIVFFLAWSSYINPIQDYDAFSFKKENDKYSVRVDKTHQIWKPITKDDYDRLVKYDQIRSNVFVFWLLGLGTIMVYDRSLKKRNV